MGRRKISTTVYFTLEQARGLAELSQATHLPMAEIVRAGLDYVLAMAQRRPELLFRLLAEAKYVPAAQSMAEAEQRSSAHRSLPEIELEDPREESR